MNPFLTRMRHQVSVDLAEARVDVFPESLKFGMLLLGKLQSPFQHRPSAFGAVLGLVGVAPVADKELRIKSKSLNKGWTL